TPQGTSYRGQAAGRANNPESRQRSSSRSFGEASLSFVLFSRVPSSYEMKMPSTTGVIKHLQVNLKGFTASRKSIQSGSQSELSNACHLLQPRALQLPSAAQCFFLPCRPKPHSTLGSARVLHRLM
ncbi:hypothetical protein TcCL_ESM10531, partial [Trypanosoma cruzi]